MSDSADVLIVGCGAQGLSIARNLVRRGLTVIAIDSAGPGEQTSARAAGQSVIAQTDPAMGSWMHRSIASIINFTAETGIALPFHQVGSVKYACSTWSAEQLGREVERASALGARVSMIDLARAGTLAPHTNPSAALAAWYAPDDIYFESTDLNSALYQDGKAAGVDYRFETTVTGLRVSEQRVHGVDTTHGPLSSDVVVLAAGSWSGPLLDEATGVKLPVVYVRHQYSIRAGVPNIRPQLPSVRVVDHAVYARPVGTDLMFGTYEPHPLTFDVEDIPSRTDLVPLDPAPINEALFRVAALFPNVTHSAIKEIRGGVVTMTPDGSYIIDQSATATGLYFLGGCNVMGLSVAPALGEDVAEWIATGQKPESLDAFALSRFSSEPRAEEDLKRSGLTEYEAIYRDAVSQPHVRPYGAIRRVGADAVGRDAAQRRSA